jgi:hypothetical protein
MSDGSVLFITGLLVILMGHRLCVAFGFFIPKNTDMSLAFWSVVLVGCAFALSITFEVYANQFLKSNSLFLQWLTLGFGNPLMGGLSAGLIILVILDLIDVRDEQISTWVRVPIAISPAIAIFILYLISIPGAWQKFGLSGFEGFGVKLTLSPPPPTSTVNLSGNEYRPGAMLTSTGHDFPPTLSDMVKSIPNERPPTLAAATYFYRETIYRELVDGPKKNEQVSAIEAQRRFLASLAPALACLKTFHDTFPDVPGLADLVSPALEGLVGVDLAFRRVWIARLRAARGLVTAAPEKNGSQLGQSGDPTLSVAIKHLQDRLAQVFSDANKRLPVNLLNSVIDRTRQDTSQPLCPSNIELAPIDIPSAAPNVNESPFTAPYIAIFIAYAYKGVESPSTGLNVLRTWMTDYADNMATVGDEARPAWSRWLLEQAAIQFALIADDTAFPKSTWQRNMLDATRAVLENDLDPYVDSTLRSCDKATATVGIIEDAKARLATVYSSVLQRFLHAVVDSRSLSSTDTLTPRHAYLAKRLIDTAKRCLAGENASLSATRQVLNLFEGGRTLAVWASEGQRTGFVVPFDAAPIRKEARDALALALPLLRHLDGSELGRTPAFQVDLQQAPWEPYRRMAETETLELDRLIP